MHTYINYYYYYYYHQHRQRVHHYYHCCYNPSGGHASTASRGTWSLGMTAFGITTSPQRGRSGTSSAASGARFVAITSIAPTKPEP